MTRGTGGLSLLSLIGIHPAAAVVAAAVDVMLFGKAGLSLGTAWVLSIPIGCVVAIVVTLFQRWGAQDVLGLAAAKGISIGLLTAIPTPLPSAATLGLGALGGIKMFRDRR